MRTVLRAAAVVLLTSILVPACVGRVVAVPVGTDHPANPAAAAGTFPPVRPEFSVERPTWDGAAATVDPHAGHGAHAGHSGAAAESPAASPATDQPRIDGAVSAYLAVARALAADDFSTAVAHAHHFRGAVKDLAAARDAGLREAGALLAKAGDDAPKDIAAARDAFKAWSPVLIQLVHRTPQSARTARALREVYCPMAGASWLQESEVVANPYFGATMPRCGRVTSVVEGRKEPAK